MIKDLIVSFTGKVKRKHLAQFDFINELGMTIDTFVNFEFEQSLKFIKKNNRLFQAEMNFFKRFKQVKKHIKDNQKRIHHIQLFSSGRYNPIYIALAKYYSIPILLVERGGLNQYIRKGYLDKLTYFSCWLLYKKANYTWYKEVFMKKPLEKMKCKNLHFIPNSIAAYDCQLNNKIEERKIDYVWINGVVPLRHIDWIVKIAKEKEFSNKTFRVFGFMDREYSQKKLKELSVDLSHNIELKPYQENVLKHMNDSKFFLLQSEYVFGNFSLLESMARGAVPLVSNVEGTNKIVIDGFNGITHHNDYNSFRKVMLKTLNMDKSDWNKLSINSAQTIQKDFSIESFKTKLYDLYKKINPLPNEN